MTEKAFVSIVTESAIEDAVIERIMDLGVDSYTTTEVRSRGPRHGNRWEPKEHQAVRIDVLCDAALGQAITSTLSDQYFRGYSMTITLSAASVRRSHPS